MVTMTSQMRPATLAYVQEKYASFSCPNNLWSLWIKNPHNPIGKPIRQRKPAKSSAPDVICDHNGKWALRKDLPYGSLDRYEWLEIVTIDRIPEVVYQEWVNQGGHKHGLTLQQFRDRSLVCKKYVGIREDDVKFVIRMIRTHTQVDYQKHRTQVPQVQHEGLFAPKDMSDPQASLSMRQKQPAALGGNIVSSGMNDHSISSGHVHDSILPISDRPQHSRPQLKLTQNLLARKSTVIDKHFLPPRPQINRNIHRPPGLLAAPRANHIFEDCPSTTSPPLAQPVTVLGDITNYHSATNGSRGSARPNTYRGKENIQTSTVGKTNARSIMDPATVKNTNLADEQPFTDENIDRTAKQPLVEKTGRLTKQPLTDKGANSSAAILTKPSVKQLIPEKNNKKRPRSTSSAMKAGREEEQTGMINTSTIRQENGTGRKMVDGRKSAELNNDDAPAGARSPNERPSKKTRATNLSAKEARVKKLVAIPKGNRQTMISSLASSQKENRAKKSASAAKTPSETNPRKQAQPAKRPSTKTSIFWPAGHGGHSNKYDIDWSMPHGPERTAMFKKIDEERRKMNVLKLRPFGPALRERGFPPYDHPKFEKHFETKAKHAARMAKK